MDDAAGQVGGPVRVEKGEFVADAGGKAGGDLVDILTATGRQIMPSGKVQRGDLFPICIVPISVDEVYHLHLSDLGQG